MAHWFMNTIGTDIAIKKISRSNTPSNLGYFVWMRMKNSHPNCRMPSLNLLPPPPEVNGAYFPRKVWFLGRWITHGDWYPDHSLRLIRNGRGIWRGSREHDKMDLDGNALELQGDLYHYSNPTMNSQLRKLEYFSDIFLQRQLESGKRWSAISAIFRGFWRFFRAYIFRLGFLDGFPGFYIAWFTAFSTFYRHSRMYEHLNHTEYPPDA